MRLPWSRSEPEEELFTLSRCGKCSGRGVRAHEEGDAVLGRTSCAECGGEARIVRIYSAPPTPQ